MLSVDLEMKFFSFLSSESLDYPSSI